MNERHSSGGEATHARVRGVMLATGHFESETDLLGVRQDYVWRGKPREAWALKALADAEREHGAPKVLPEKFTTEASRKAAAARTAPSGPPRCRNNRPHKPHTALVAGPDGEPVAVDCPGRQAKPRSDRLRDADQRRTVVQLPAQQDVTRRQVILIVTAPPEINLTMTSPPPEPLADDRRCSRCGYLLRKCGGNCG